MNYVLRLEQKIDSQGSILIEKKNKSFGEIDINHVFMLIPLILGLCRMNLCVIYVQLLKKLGVCLKLPLGKNLMVFTSHSSFLRLVE